MRCADLPSFASELRRQLSAQTVSGIASQHAAAELAGLLDAAGSWDDSGVTLRTSSPAVARSAVRLWRSAFGISPRLAREPADSFLRARYAVRADGNQVLQAAEELRVARSRSLKEAVGGRSYLRGAFQGAGYVTRPGYRRGHHLEFVHRNELFIRHVAAISRTPLKVMLRRGRWVAYAKGVDGVTGLLSQMGLHDAVLEYEARAIVGEVKANANRITNFDAANAGRIAAAAARQQEAISRLDPGELPEALREIFELRLEHPDASLSELAHLGGISKSAVNHRLRRLLELAGR